MKGNEKIGRNSQMERSRKIRRNGIERQNEGEEKKK
jgi:hypothetical protein